MSTRNIVIRYHDGVKWLHTNYHPDDTYDTIITLAIENTAGIIVTWYHPTEPIGLTGLHIVTWIPGRTFDGTYYIVYILNINNRYYT